jgi:predicted transcriptional regulator
VGRKRVDEPIGYMERNPSSPVPPLPRTPNTNKIAVDVVNKEERQERALELFAKGRTTREIASLMGVSKASVSNWITAARARRFQRTDNFFERALERQVYRLEVLRKNLWEAAEKRIERITTVVDPDTGKALKVIVEDREPNPQTFAQLVKVEDQIARLLGLLGLPSDLKRTPEGMPTPTADGIVIPIESVLVPDGVSKEQEKTVVPVDVVVENPSRGGADPNPPNAPIADGSSSGQGAPAGEEPADIIIEDALRNPSFS